MVKAKRQSDIKKYIQAILVFLVAVVAAFAVFLVVVQKAVTKNVRETIQERVETQGRHAKDILEAQYDSLEGAASYLGINEDVLSAENMDLARAIQEKSALENVAVIDMTGMAHYTDGSTESVASRKYFWEGSAGKTSLSNPVETEEGVYRIILAVPIFRDGTVVGVLAGDYDLTSLCRSLFANIYDGEGEVLILASDGTVIANSDMEEVLNIKPGKRFFGYFQKKFGTADDESVMKYDFQIQQAGHLHAGKGEEECHWAYTPLGMNRWMVCYVVPVSKAQEDYAFIQEYEAVLTAVFALLVVLFLGILLRIGRKRQRALIRSASMDALTGLFNKKNTEEKIQRWLERSVDLISVIQVFMIMDVDFFKEINDKYGHAAGDEVLRGLGEQLRSQFRKEDILGRVGGDEFVVFMKDVKTPRDAERKAEELCSRIRKMKIPALGGKSITCSIGMAYYPSHGRNYMELYKLADAVLYETKRKGKNGFTVYREDFAREESTQEEQENYVRRAYTEINPLTGLYYNRAFFRIADEYLKQIPKGTHMLVAVDVEHFKLFNSLYGREEGDQLLIFISSSLKQISQEQAGVAGYLGGDNFCLLVPKSMEVLEQLQKDIAQKLESWFGSVGFLPGFGVYYVDDKDMSAAAMYDRAVIALGNVYGNYVSRICVYDPDMEKKLEEEVELVAEIRTGLERQEFVIYIQPQCNISTGEARVVGGECLVRWQHPTRGLLSPGAFLPVLEKTGFVAELDRYVWKQTCKWMQSWIERGNIPVPVSVNVSRIDIFSMDVPAYLKSLVSFYQISTAHLKIEITESAYAENDERIRSTVRQLRDAGFMVMMDDFGSGYSSLNMLKSVAVDALKLDMKFMKFDKQEQERSLGIVESVIGMSRQMGIPVIVEGIETNEQEEFLLQMGCRYVQGYYYYRPMPLSEFEVLLSDEKNLDYGGFTVSQVNNLRIREFLDDNVLDEGMLNNILGAAAFYDVYENRVEITSVNEHYSQLTGMECGGKGKVQRKFWSHVRGDERQKLLLIFRQAYEQREKGAQGHIHYLRSDGKMLDVFLQVYYIWERDGHRAFYGTLTDVTSLMKKQEKTELTQRAYNRISREEQEELDKYYGSLPSAFGVGELVTDEAGGVETCEMVYMNKVASQFSGENPGVMRTDIQKLFLGKEDLLEECKKVVCEKQVRLYRAYSSLSGRYLTLTLFPFWSGYVGMLLQDVTQAKVEEEMVYSMAGACREIYYVHLEDNHYRMIYPDANNLLEQGNYEEAINRHFGTGKIADENEETIRRFLSVEYVKEQLTIKPYIECQYRRRTEDNKVEWCSVVFTPSEKRDDIPITAIMTIRSVDSWMKHKEKIRVSEVMNHISNGFFIYEASGEERILYANPQMQKLFGCSSAEEFMDLVGGSFKGVVHPDDLERVEVAIERQIANSDKQMDYIEYRIIRKDGKVLWVEDYGHREEREDGNDIFYVFVEVSKDKNE